MKAKTTRCLVTIPLTGAQWRAATTKEAIREMLPSALFSALSRAEEMQAVATGIDFTGETTARFELRMIARLSGRSMKAAARHGSRKAVGERFTFRPQKMTAK